MRRPVVRLRPRSLAAVPLVLVLAAGSPGSAAPTDSREVPVRGAPGVGDPYFPLDGNAGIDVLHYDIHARYDFASARLGGRTRSPSARHRGPVPVQPRPAAAGRVGARRRAGGGVRRTTGTSWHHPGAPAGRGHRRRGRGRYAGRPGRSGTSGSANWLADDREVVDDERAAHGAVVVPGERPPDRQGAVRHRGPGAGGRQVVANGAPVDRVQARRHHDLALAGGRPDGPLPRVLRRRRLPGRPGRARRSALVRRGVPAAPEAEPRASMRMLRRTPGRSWLARVAARPPTRSRPPVAW